VPAYGGSNAAGREAVLESGLRWHTTPQSVSGLRPPAVKHAPPAQMLSRVLATAIRRVGKPHRCFYPWLNMRVDPFGNVYPCSVDVRLGSLRSSSARDVWNGEEYRSFRKALKKADLFPMCARCCALGNRLWNKLPNLSISLPSLKGAAIRPGEHAVSDLVPTRTREPLNNYCQ
jgi:radical SAM protein with 4Fe4S-binding SPASM domain